MCVRSCCLLLIDCWPQEKRQTITRLIDLRRRCDDVVVLSLCMEKREFAQRKMCEGVLGVLFLLRQTFWNWWSAVKWSGRVGLIAKFCIRRENWNRFGWLCQCSSSVPSVPFYSSEWFACSSASEKVQRPLRSSQSFTGRREKWKTRAKRRFLRIWRHSAGSKAFGGCAKATRNASEWPRARCCSSKSSKIQLRSSKQPLFEARKLWSLYLGQKSNRSQPSSSLKRPRP